jgi:hypothetical protein
MNEIGVSDTVTNMILKRSRNDCYLLIFLFVATILLIFLLLYFVKPMISGSAVKPDLLST